MAEKQFISSIMKYASSYLGGQILHCKPQSTKRTQNNVLCYVTDRTLYIHRPSTEQNKTQKNERSRSHENSTVCGYPKLQPLHSRSLLGKTSTERYYSNIPKTVTSLVQPRKAQNIKHVQTEIPANLNKPSDPPPLLIVVLRCTSSL